MQWWLGICVCKYRYTRAPSISQFSVLWTIFQRSPPFLWTQSWRPGFSSTRVLKPFTIQKHVFTWIGHSGHAGWFRAHFLFWSQASQVRSNNRRVYPLPFDTFSLWVYLYYFFYNSWLNNKLNVHIFSSNGTLPHEFSKIRIQNSSQR